MINCAFIRLVAHRRFRSLTVNVYKEELAKRLSSESNKKTNPLDSLNFETEEFRSCVKQLANHLRIPPHTDDITTLKAVLVYVRNRLDDQPPDDEKRKSSIFKLEEIPSGTNCEIKEISEAVRLMRLLYINNLRDLQTSINQILVNLQSITGECRPPEWRMLNQNQNSEPNFWPQHPFAYQND